MRELHGRAALAHLTKHGGRRPDRGALVGANLGSRTLCVNCMGVLLLPISLNMAGVGPTVAHWLGLI